jgi:hypothetical protein
MFGSFNFVMDALLARVSWHYHFLSPYINFLVILHLFGCPPLSAAHQNFRGLLLGYLGGGYLRMHVDMEQLTRMSLLDPTGCHKF